MHQHVHLLLHPAGELFTVIGECPVELDANRRCRACIQHLVHAQICPDRALLLPVLDQGAQVLDQTTLFTVDVLIIHPGIAGCQRLEDLLAALFVLDVGKRKELHRVRKE